MEDPSSGSRYAKACRECATTKTKCVRQAARNKCERCLRLNKDCKARAATTRAPRPQRPNRITQMEKKLDGLVELLAISQSKLQSQALPSALPDAHALPTPNSLSPDSRTYDLGHTQAPLFGVGPSGENNGKCLCSDHLFPKGGPSKDSVMGIMTPSQKYMDACKEKSLPVLELNDQASSALLANYQSSMAHFFPFVIIPSNTTAPHLRVSKPFLFLAVMAVSSYEKTGQQTTMSIEIMRLLSEKMLFQGEKSLDLLQGLLVYIEWYHSHRLTDPQLTNLLQLSVALLVDVCLTKNPFPCEKHHMLANSTKLLHDDSAVLRYRTNEDRRAILGCFYLTSASSFCFKKLDAIRYTLHMEESCNTLSQSPEYESDVYLVHLVKLHKITDEITQTLPYDAPTSFWAAKPPIDLLIKSFQTELKKFKDQLPPSLQEHSCLLLHLHTTTTYLHEIALSSPSSTSSGFPSTSFPYSTVPPAYPNLTISPPSIPMLHGNPQSFPSYPAVIPSPHARIAPLHSLLLSTVAFLNHYLSLRPTVYSSHPFSTWSQTLYALQMLAKLSLVNDVPGWDYAFVRGVMDFTSLMEEMGRRFDEADRGEGRPGTTKGDEGTIWGEMRDDGGGWDLEKLASRNRYEIYAQRVKRLKVWFEAKVAAMEGAKVSQRAEVEGSLGGESGVNMGATGNEDGLGIESLGVQGELRDDFMTGNYTLDAIDDAALWHDFMGEWGMFQE